MPEQTTGPLFQARLFLLSAVNGLVTFARTLPEGIERDAVRQAVRETANALTRIFPPAVATAAQEHALRQIEVQPEEGGLVPISGVTVEMYADQLARYLFAYGEEQQGT